MKMLIVVLLLACAARGQDGVGGLEVAGLDVLAVQATLGGAPVTVLVLGEMVLIPGLSPLPLRALNMLDGGMEPASVGSSACWGQTDNLVAFQNVTTTGTGATLECAVKAFHAAQAAMACEGWVKIPCP